MSFSPRSRREVAITIASIGGAVHAGLTKLAELLPTAERSLTREEAAAVIAVQEKATEAAVEAIKLSAKILGGTSDIAGGN